MAALRFSEEEDERCRENEGCGACASTPFCSYEEIEMLDRSQEKWESPKDDSG